MALGGANIVKNAGAATQQVISQVSVPFRRIRLLASATLADLIRSFNLLVESVDRATLAARSLPFGGPYTYVQDVAFTNTVDTVIPHLLQTTNVRAWIGLPNGRTGFGGVTAGSPYAVVTLVDDNFITFAAKGTFTADVLLVVIP